VKFSVYVPARFAATRLPGKPLLTVAGKTLIRHVWERANASGALRVVVATDDARIADEVRSFGGLVAMTDVSHQSGSDRIAEAARALGEDDDAIIVNLQGDEPTMPASVVRQVARMLYEDPQADMATVCERFARESDWRDPNQVKVLRDDAGRAIYFSRAPLPFPRDPSPWAAGPEHCRHIGLYAYRGAALQRLVQWPPHALELTERLEQLRALAHGMAIKVEEATEACGVGIDTPEDLARFEAELAAERMPSA
jgi:3-deoxy-manno-octulosonate cytidylyltransferase (CMP-KDO synthetase)